MWGLPMKAHGRKYDHAVVEMTFKLKQRSKQPGVKRDLQALKLAATLDSFESKLKETERPQDTREAWMRLKLALQSAKETLPVVK